MSTEKIRSELADAHFLREFLVWEKAYPNYPWTDWVGLTGAIGRVLTELDRIRADRARLTDLIQQMLNVAENADETGYVTDCGFVDLDKLYADVRAAIDAIIKDTPT